MEKEQAASPRINKEEEAFFVQNDFFEYWTPETETTQRIFYSASSGPETGYVSQRYDIFYDLSLELHEEELNCLHTDDAGIALVGGAGTGKTHALSSLAGYWIREGIFKADEVLVITFTKSETGDIAAGIMKTAGQRGAGAFVTCIDRFCFRILCAGYGTAPRIFNANDRKYFMGLIFPFLSEETLESFCSFIDSKEMKKNCESLEDFPHLREAYLDSLIRIKACDLGALAIQAAQAVSGNPGILFTMQHKYRCIIIDDLQRMDKHHYDLLSRIITHNILVETDPGRIQKIVVGVDPLQREKKTHRNSVCEMFLSNYIRRRFFLSRSWRVPGRILSCVSRLYGKENVKKGVPKTHKKQGTHILLYRAKNPREEADFIKDSILSFVKKDIKKDRAYPSDGYTWDDFGIFSRKKEDLKEITASLVKAHIPFTIHETESFSEKEPFQRINSLFHFVLSDRDVAAFTDILLNLFNGFSIGQVKSIFISGNRKDEPLSNLILRLYNEKNLTDSQYSGITRLFKIKNRVKKEVSESGIMAGISDLCIEFPMLELSLMNFPEERQFYMEYADSCGNDIKKFLTEQPFIQNGRRDKQGNSRVHLSTFHHVKGFELPVLFIAGMEEGNCPLYNKSPDIEIETGLFYSAITRVKERVYLSYSESKSGEKREVSSFIREMGSYVKEIIPTPVNPEEFEQQALFH